jgi:putative aldouronate transport system substrate-binding protein
MPHQPTLPELSRRTFIRRSSGAMLAGAAGIQVLLDACVPTNTQPSAGSTSQTQTAAGKASVFPTYVASTTPAKPDFHSSDPRVEDGFNSYPASPFKSWNGPPPSNGGTLNAFMLAYAAPATPRDQNPAWREIERQLNATVLMNITPSADYRVKLATTLAGNDLPDLIHISPGYAAAPNLPDFFRARCADLTPYLSGDAAKDYPNLAAIPTYAWKNSISALDGKLYCVPLQRYLPAAQQQGGFLFKNSDLWDSVIGKGVEPTNADDLKRMMQQFVVPGVRWAFGNIASLRYGLAVFTRMFGSPNTWRLGSDGKLTRDYETDEFKAGLGYMRDLWSAGLVWPDGQTSTDSRSNFIGQKFALSLEAYGIGWADFWRRGLQQNPPVHFALMKPFAAQAGQKPQAYLSGGFFAMNVLKQAPPDRIRELLRIMDWLAAPFGSQEDLLLTYGVQGDDYTLDANANPVSTQRGATDAAYSAWKYICQRPQVNYQADLPGYAQACWDAEQQIFPIGVEDPTNGYYSPTQFGSAAFSAEQKMTDGLNDIIVGREPLSSFDDLVKSWQTTAGNQIRQELQSAMAAQSA